MPYFIGYTFALILKNTLNLLSSLGNCTESPGGQEPVTWSGRYPDGWCPEDIANVPHRHAWHDQSCFISR